MTTISYSRGPLSLGRRARRVILLAVASLAVAVVPGVSAGAVTLPLPLSTATPTTLSVPTAPSGALAIVSGSTAGSGGGSSGSVDYFGYYGGSSITPSLVTPDGAAVLTGLRDAGATFLGGSSAPSDSSADGQGPNDNRGLSQQSAEMTRQQYVMTAQVYALDFSQDALDAAFAGGGGGQFAWPEQVRTISQGFGCTSVRLAPTNSQCPSGHFHTGLDIAGPNLADVHSADTGVARVFPGTTGYGNYIVVTHGNGYSTLYGHLHDFTVKDGQLVHRGDVIAHEGTTGNSTGPHVHFEIRQWGNYLDPCPFLEGCKGY
jgi:murein DD-endopeptidase MepM/ murein hydrolase activator NlpD